MITIQKLRKAYDLGYESNVAKIQAVAVAVRGAINQNFDEREDRELEETVREAEQHYNQSSRLERFAYGLGSIMSGQRRRSGREYDPITEMMTELEEK